MLTPDHLKKILHYNPLTGKLTWLERPASMFRSNTSRRSPESSAKTWNKKYSGSTAGSKKKRYTALFIDGTSYTAHRVAWAIFHGEWPKGEIDHINGDIFDDRMSNLREVSHSENMANKKTYKNSKTGVTGVYKLSSGKWVAQIRRDGKLRHLGTFNCLEAAASSRKNAEAALGFHENHGRQG